MDPAPVSLPSWGTSLRRFARFGLVMNWRRAERYRKVGPLSYVRGQFVLGMVVMALSPLLHLAPSIRPAAGPVAEAVVIVAAVAAVQVTFLVLRHRWTLAWARRFRGPTWPYVALWYLGEAPGALQYLLLVQLSTPWVVVGAVVNIVAASVVHPPTAREVRAIEAVSPAAARAVVAYS